MPESTIFIRLPLKKAVWYVSQPERRGLGVTDWDSSEQAMMPGRTSPASNTECRFVARGPADHLFRYARLLQRSDFGSCANVLGLRR